MKHSVAFMSPEHRESSFLFQLFEFEEDKLFFKGGNEKEENKYIPGVGEFLRSEPTLVVFADEARMEIKEMLKMEQNGGRQED